MEEDSSIHQRVLVLRDVALGVNKNSKLNPNLTPACFDSTVDSLLALHEECSQATGLSKNTNVTNFLGKYKGTVEALRQLRIMASDFEVRGIIGRGHFGEVQVVQEKSTKEVYAMKIMKKAHILQQADSACFSEERDIMAWATSPWLTRLHYAFQDVSSLYLVMDYHPGGDLLTIMERMDGGMSENEARFYLSELGAALNDLHQLGFVHRDVKPENVLISHSGHIKLVDFGSAARLKENGKVIDSRLPVGTPEYIAPEVLTSLDKTGDYGVACDWWSLGIIAYELLYVSTPFEGDSTTVTYGNIMNYKDSLSFPDDVSTSGEFQALVKSLLIDPDERLSYSQLKKHQFFNSVDWDHLLAALPPYVPSITSPDDISNFDTFEPQKENLSATFQSKTLREFSGKSLPFVGFTFTRVNHTQFNFTDSQSEPPVSVSEVTNQRLEGTQGELIELKERNRSLEKECVIYQSQLKDYHQQLERERVDRRLSDARAMKLLEEVKVHSETLRELRKEELSDKEVELGLVVSQLEQDRQVVSNKVRRLQSELENSGTERDVAVKVAVELKAKFKALKESSKKDISKLQSRLHQMNKDSSQAVSVHDKLTDAVEKYVTANKKLKAIEEVEKKRSMKMLKLEASVSSRREEAERLRAQLETLTSEHLEHSRALEIRVEAMSSEKSGALQRVDQLKLTNQELTAELMKANSNVHTVKVKSKTEGGNSLAGEVRSLQHKLSDTGETAIKQSERLREVRAEKRTLDLEYSQLKIRLNKAEADMDKLRKQVEAKNKRLSILKQLETKLAETEAELSSLQESDKALDVELEVVKGERDRLMTERGQMKVELQSVSDKLATEELTHALLQRKVKLLEEEVADSKTTAEELTAAQDKWKTHKATLISDLETAEARLDNHLTTMDRVKNAKIVAEKKQAELLAQLEGTQTSHSEEISEYKEQLDSQKQLVATLDQKVLTVEKEFQLTELTLRETKKDLDTEKACYSKTYEDLYTLHRDYRVLKAAYNKLCRESEEQKSELTLTTEVRDRMLSEQRSAADAHQLQETRMQSTIEQQSKLIDYLQGVGVSPRSTGLSKLAKSLRFGRKGRDPAKEIAEWNKLKKFIGKPQKGINMSQSSASSQELSLSATSFSPPEVITSLDTPLTRSSRKSRHPKSAASPQFAKLDKSTVLKFPVTSLAKDSKQATNEGLDSGADTSEMNVSMEVAKENVSGAVKFTGKKRKRQTSAGVESDCKEPAEKIRSIRHNIPHNFQLRKTGIHKTYKCVGCKEPIKKLQRYAKCSYCHIVCHPSCMEGFPNDCGLPAELAAHTLPKHTSSDKPPTQEDREITQNELNESEISCTNQLFTGQDQVVASTPILEPLSFRATPTVVKSERLALLRGSLKTLGWLLLKKDSLHFYDRNPDHSVTRKPLCSFDFTSSDSVYHILTAITERNELFRYSEKQLTCAFGLRKYSNNNLDQQKVIFLAPSLQNKIEWVEAIGEVLSALTLIREQLVYGDADDGKVVVTKRRSLKAVSIVPFVKTSRRSGDGVSVGGSELDMSIRSSMLNDSEPSLESVV